MPSTITWQCAKFSELTVQQLYAILAARSEVFVVEQNCVFPDMDGLDAESLHLSAWNQQGQLAAYLRIVPPGLKYPQVSLGRVVTSPAARGTGVGKQLMAKGLENLYIHYPGAEVLIQAQQYLEKFYQSFGFITISDVLMEDGIPHYMMHKPAA
jgi:ElaA protein